MRGQTKNLTGLQYGKLTVIKRNGSNKHRSAMWLCQCDCSRQITVSTGALNSGHYVTCGKCLCERTASGKKKGEPIQSIFSGMKDRCYNERCKSFKRYGGRNIKICDEWLHSREAFEAWARASGYVHGLTIDRRDNDGPYSPENCRWVNLSIQANNKSTNHSMVVDGIKMNVTECANKYGIGRSLLYFRLNKKKMSDFDAVNTPIDVKKRNLRHGK